MGIQCPSCGQPIDARRPRCPACGADVRIWLRRGDQIWGPYTWATVQRGLRAGRVSPDDLIQIGTTGNWQRLGDIAGPARCAAWPIAAGVAFGVLAAAVVASWFILASSFSRARSVHRQAICQAQLRQVYLACKVYRLDYGAAPPISGNLPERLSEYLPDEAAAWSCPSTGQPYAVYSSGRLLAADTGDKRPHPRGYAAITRRGEVVMLDKPPPGGIAVNLGKSRKQPAETDLGSRPSNLARPR